MRLHCNMDHERQCRSRPAMIASALLLITPVLLIGAPVGTSARNGSSGSAALSTAAGDGAAITPSGQGGYVRSLRTVRGSRVAVPGTGAEARARAFMNRFGDAFVADGSRLELVTARVKERSGGKVGHVRFQQTLDGIPVRAAEAIVHLDDAGVTAATSNLLPSPEGVGTRPSVTAAAALESAAGIVTKIGATEASYSTPRLEIFSLGLLDGRAGDRAKLAWFIEAKAPALRQFIWIDAVGGEILYHFSQLKNSRNRLTYDSEYTDQQRKTLVRSEGMGDISDTDADNAHNFAGDAYDLFWQAFGRDSYDNLGGSIISNVRYCPPAPTSCSGYEDAFWDGMQLTYSEGFSAADDIVAHEFTHGVVEHSSNFLYRNQSGAIDESYSDIFGELTDQLNNTIPDGSEWLIGEDLGVGPLRDMMTPVNYGQPGRTSDPHYYCGADDNGGVHTNSGVGNHAFALMAAGGTYNSVTVNAIGNDKTAAVYYEALTNYLGPGATWADNYTALNIACADISTAGGGTTGITAPDCTEVQKALDAVEMDATPCALPTVTLCTEPQIPHYHLKDDLEDPGSGGWSLSVDSAFGIDHWGGSGFGAPGVYWTENPYSGSFSFWGYNFDEEGDSSVEMDSSSTLPDGAAFLFYGDFSFETGWDGGVVEYSTDHGATWTDAGSLMDDGQMYNGTLDPANPLGARPAFTGSVGGYTGTLLDLSSLSSMPFRARFRIGTDNSISDFGWFVDDVAIFTCGYPDPHDWNTDRKADLFWRNQQGGMNYLWHLDGSTFLQGAAIPPAGTDWVVGGVGHFNGDTTPDILWRNSVTGAITLWFMNGTGVDATQSIATVADLNWEVAAVEDADRNGIADILWRNYSTGATTIWYLDGALNWTAAALPPAGTGWRIEAMADFDGDGSSDILWRNYSTGQNAIWTMSGTSFTGFVPLSTVPDPGWRIVQASDFNGDGMNDILWRNYDTGVNYVWYWNDSGPLTGGMMPPAADTGWAIEN
ncbi:M4 family metallopeptidase [Candidatus Moduliflexota bacterium]